MTQQMLNGLRQSFLVKGVDMVTAQRQAEGAIWVRLEQQAAMLSYNDVFRFLGSMFLILLPLLLLMEKPKGAGPTLAH